MEKPANSDYPILDVIKRRWSPRAFGDRLIEPNKVRQLFEAARWAASSYNEQPWRFIIAAKDNEKEFKKVLDCLLEANQTWAKQAPLLILTVSKKTFSKNSKPNRVHVHDVGLAMANLTLQATAMGLFTHQMAGVDLDKVRKTFKIPDDFEPQTACAVGYAGDPESLPDPLKAAEMEERTRMPLTDLVFTGKWEEPSAHVKP
jgi:nitroreductase